MNDSDILIEIQKTAENYGVKSTTIYPHARVIEVQYHQIGQGCVLSNLIGEMLDTKAPKRDYNLKMIPSDLKLVVSLF